jgi:hypothetical protein
MSSSMAPASSLSPAKVSIMIPNIIWKNRAMIIMKNEISKNASKNKTSLDSLKKDIEGRLSPTPPPALRSYKKVM